MKKIVFTLLCLFLALCGLARAAELDAANAVARGPRVEMSLDVGRAPADFPVQFCLLTHGGRQYVGYFDEDHRMTVASRRLDSRLWHYQVLPSRVGCDTHNYITMAADDEGQIHLSGNMHCAPLVYFRTRPGADPPVLERIRAMVGRNETRCTYPKFLRGPDETLVFHYRDGKSGNGVEIFNVYSARTRAWRRLLDKPLTDGQGERNAYMAGPVRGRDGWFHLCWVWRDTPDCSTNHDPSYARSRDLVHWETAAGEAIELPITLETPGVIVDRVAVHSGLINGALQVGFDHSDRPLVSYHKFDERGNNQAYIARFEDGRWAVHKITDWDYRWEFKGGGSINSEIRLGTVQRRGTGTLVLPYSHKKYGAGSLVLDEATLRLRGTGESAPRYPKELCRVESTFEGMTVRWADDLGEASDPSARYVLRWETLPSNRDRQRTGPLPAPSMLRLHRLSARAGLEPTTVVLWPGKPPGEATAAAETREPDQGDGVLRITNVGRPTMTVYPVDKGGSPAPAVLVCPGGGYRILAFDKEGTEVARWLNSRGVASAVLKYRVPDNRAGALADAQRALGLLRLRAREWNIDAGRIGVIGFSAGGHLAARLSNDNKKRSYPEVDKADHLSCRPDFSILVYPAYLSDKNYRLAGEVAVTADTPPAFLVQTQDDHSYVNSSIAYYLALKKAGVAGELHLFPAGGHGYALRPTKHAVSRWPDLCEAWVRDRGVLSPKL